MIQCAVCQRHVYCKGYCRRHYIKLRRHGDPLHGYEQTRIRGTGTIHVDGYIELKINGRSRLEHLLIAEKALGKSLPRLARVHHVDENRANNANNNLVICPDQSYHQLLHKRMRALAGCGNASWLKCQYCKQWDEPRNIVTGKRVLFHRACKNSYEARRTA